MMTINKIEYNKTKQNKANNNNDKKQNKTKKQQDSRVTKAKFVNRTEFCPQHGK